MMKRIAVLLLTFAWSNAPQASDYSGRALTTGEAAVISRSIAGLKAMPERRMAIAWSIEKKLAEFICRPLAQDILRQQQRADRVFLGGANGSHLTLTADELSGNGSYRQPTGWVDISFTCRVDGDTGKAESFSYRKLTTPGEPQ